MTVWTCCAGFTETGYPLRCPSNGAPLDSLYTILTHPGTRAHSTRGKERQQHRVPYADFAVMRPILIGPQHPHNSYGETPSTQGRSHSFASWWPLGRKRVPAGSDRGFFDVHQPVVAHDDPCMISFSAVLSPGAVCAQHTPALRTGLPMD